jgi:predicted GIY-YIG superfamily endonuclease
MTRPAVDWTNGVIYLIHFSKKFGHAGHYLGLASDFDSRMARHRKGHGSNLIKKIQEAGIEWEVVRKWEIGLDAPAAEKELKKMHNNRSLCPICQKQYAFEKAEHMRSQRHAAKDLRSPKARYEEVIAEKGDTK